jgi:fructokinase
MILCCGEALIDMVPEGSAYRPLVGGAVFNTAMALGRLGAPVSLLTGLSSDRFGRMIAQALADSGVGDGSAISSHRPTTLAMVHLENGQASYGFYDAGTATREIVPWDLPDPATLDGALFCGGISLCNPPGADSLADFAAAWPVDRVVMVDPNIRPGFADDEPTYRARLARVLARADIVKMSDADLAWVLPGVSGVEAQAEAVRAMGPSLVLVTMGEAGSMAFCASGASARRPAAAAQVVDTIGAGDTFNAGCLFALHRAGKLTPGAVAALDTDTLAALLDFAGKVAAVTVSRAGANPPWASEVGA